jgi:hypothetical protein
VIWEVLSAKRLFKADNDAATLTRLISDRIPALSDLCPDIGPNLSAVVAKALERDPERRFASCAQLADALEEAGATDSEVGASRDLSAYVREAIGSEIAQQREAVRLWLTRSESNEAEPERWPTSLSGGSITVSGGSDSRSGITTNQASSNSMPTSVTVVTRSSPVPLVIALGAVAALLVVVIILLLDRRDHGDEPPVQDERRLQDLGPRSTEAPKAVPQADAGPSEPRRPDDLEIVTPEALPTTPPPKSPRDRKPAPPRAPRKPATADETDHLLNPYR